jgi:hypothetical protein
VRLQPHRAQPSGAMWSNALTEQPLVCQPLVPIWRWPSPCRSAMGTSRQTCFRPSRQRHCASSSARPRQLPRRRRAHLALPRPRRRPLRAAVQGQAPARHRCSRRARARRPAQTDEAPRSSEGCWGGTKLMRSIRWCELPA